MIKGKLTHADDGGRDGHDGETKDAIKENDILLSAATNDIEAGKKAGSLAIAVLTFFF